MSNKSNGTAFEREFAEMLSARGFWAHLMQDNSNGQPFDVIAAKNGSTFVFDCKDCTGSRFEFRRMEENQRNAMQLWLDCGNQNAMFAVRYSGNQIYLFEFTDLVAYEEERKSISQNEAITYGYTMDEFMRIFVHESNNQ